VTWELSELPANASRELCVDLTLRTPGRVEFKSTAAGTVSGAAQCECQTQLIGVHSLGVEVVDLVDPVEVGQEVTYVITVQNQGDLPGTNLRVTCTVPDSQAFISGTGTTPVQAIGRSLTMQALPVIEGKATATWRIVTRALRPDDSRFKVEFRSDQFEKPIHEDEATRLY
jgi:uncharacterized repeat protein (TIGR01451 family)